MATDFESRPTIKKKQRPDRIDRNTTAAGFQTVRPPTQPEAAEHTQTGEKLGTAADIVDRFRTDWMHCEKQSP